MSGSAAADWAGAAVARPVPEALAADAARIAALARMSLIIVRSFAHNVLRAGEKYTSGSDFTKEVL